MYIDSNNVLKSVSAVDLKDKTLFIPHGVVEVGHEAIKNLPQLSSIVIPETVKRFATRSITNTGIIHLIIPQTVEEIDILAFENNEWLSIVEINNPDTKFDGTIVQNCRSLQTVRIGAIKHNVRCLKFGVAYAILSKKQVDVYTVYLVEPFRESTTGIGKLYVAVKQGVVGDGVTIKRAMEDCHNHYMTPSTILAYKDLTLDTQVNSYDYKRITGACDEGIIKWMQEEGFEENDTLSVRELIHRLKHAYGSDIFAQFVADRYKDRAEARNGSK